MAFLCLNQVGLQLYMGVLTQKCVPSYETFLNDTSFASMGYNMTYTSYELAIANSSMRSEMIDELKFV